MARMAERSELSLGAKYSAARRDRRRSRTQIYAYEEQDSKALLSQSHDYLRPRRRDLLSDSLSYRKPVSSIDSMGILVVPKNVARTLSSSSVAPVDMPEHSSGSHDTGDALQPSLQFESHPRIVQFTRDPVIEQLESISTKLQGTALHQRPVLRRGRRYLKRSYQDLPQASIVTRIFGVSDDALTKDLRLSTGRDGILQPPKTARQYRGFPDSINSMAASRTSPLLPMPSIPSTHDLSTPSPISDDSYFPTQSYSVTTAERPVSPTSRPFRQRRSTSGTVVFTPPLIIIASPNSEKSGIMQSSSSGSSGETKERMSFL